MRVAMYYANDNVKLEEADKPVCGAGELIVKVMSSGICGSDVMQWYRAGKTPLVLGHEIAGEIVEAGPGVTQFKTGQRISCSHHVPCNTCHYCLNDHHTVCDTLRKTKFYPGGFSEYLRLPAINVDRGVYILPDNVSYDEGTFVEPLACVYRGQRLSGMKTGKAVLVIGSGISGALHIALARALHASVVASTDISDYRLKMAKKFGADHVINAASDVASEFKRINNDRGADLVILTAGAPKAIEQAFKSVDRGGVILFFAPSAQSANINLPVNDLFWRNEITLASSYAANYAEHVMALNLISTGRVKVKDMITHIVPLSRAQEGFGLVAGAGESLKVIIRPQE